MVIKKFLQLLCVAAMVFSLSSCEFINDVIDNNNGEQEDEPIDGPIQDVNQGDIQLDPRDIFIDAAGGKQEVYVSTKHPWSLELIGSNDESEWCTPSTYSGEGGDEPELVIFDIAPHSEDYVREATWAFISANGSQTELIIVQHEYDPLTTPCYIRYTTSDDNPISVRDNIELYLIGYNGEPLNDGAVSSGYDEGVGTIYIEGEVRCIHGGAFSDKPTLVSVTLPDCVESFDGNPFASCPALEHFESPLATESGRELIYADESYSIHMASVAAANLTEYTTPEETVYLDRLSMHDLDNLTEITLTENIYDIGELALSDCDGITEIVIPDRVRYIRERAFEECDNLSKVTIGSGLYSLDNLVFHNCKSLNTIEIRATEPPIFEYSTFEGLDKKSIRVIVPASALQAYKDSQWWSFNLAAEGTDMEGANTITYTTSDGQPVDLYDTSDFDGAQLLSNTYDSETGVGTILFDGDLRKIPARMFYMCFTLTSVELPPFITTIDDDTFAECKELETVKLPVALENIRYDAFANCESLKEIEIPSSVTSISQGAFAGCKSLKSIILPDGLESLGGYVFSGCESLVSVNIPELITSLSGALFSGCKSLKSVELPSTLKRIPDDLFSGCESLISIDIPDSVTEIGDGAFSGCLALSNMVLSDNVTKIGSSCFKDCSNLRSITLSKNIEGIYAYTFSGCSLIKTITIPNKVTTIAHHAFSGCAHLSEVTIPYRVSALDHNVFAGCISLEKVTFSDYLERIGSSCFYNCPSLTSITLPKSITHIGREAFNYCTALQRVEIEDLKAWFDIEFDYDGTQTCNPTYLTRSLYLNGELITDLSVPEGVATIDHNDFSYLDDLKTLTIPDSYTGSFENWLSKHPTIERVTMGNGVSEVAFAALSECPKLTQVTVGGGVQEIGAKAFAKCPKLTQVTINNGVKKLSSSVFVNCTSLTSITIPSSVTEIGGSCFEGCSALQSASLGNNITALPGELFYGCSALHSVNIPTAATEIGYNCFDGCKSLSSKLTLTNVKSIGQGAFGSCESLSEVDFGDKLVSINLFAFSGCSKLQAAHLPNTLQSIAAHAFDGCSAMTHTTIGSGTTTIGEDAYANCPKLTTIRCLAITPPTVESYGGGNGSMIPDRPVSYPHIFDADIPNRRIKVPNISYEEYISAQTWSYYASQIEKD